MQTCLWAPTLNELRDSRSENQLIRATGAYLWSLRVHISVPSAADGYLCSVFWRSSQSALFFINWLKVEVVESPLTYHLGGLSFSLGSEMAPGSSGDDSSTIHHLLQECVEQGIKGARKGTFYYSYWLCVIVARQNQKTTREKIHPALFCKVHLSDRNPVSHWSPNASQCLCASQEMVMGLFGFPRRGKSNAGDIGRVKVFIPGEFEIQNGR